MEIEMKLKWQIINDLYCLEQAMSVCGECFFVKNTPSSDEWLVCSGSWDSPEEEIFKTKQEAFDFAEAMVYRSLVADILALQKMTGNNDGIEMDSER